MKFSIILPNTEFKCLKVLIAEELGITPMEAGFQIIRAIKKNNPNAHIHYELKYNNYKYVYSTSGWYRIDVNV